MYCAKTNPIKSRPIKKQKNYFYDLPIELRETIETKAVDLQQQYEARVKRNKLNCHKLWSCVELREPILDFFLTAPLFKITIKTVSKDLGDVLIRKVIMPSGKTLFYDLQLYWKSFILDAHDLASAFLKIGKPAKIVTWNLITLNSCF